MNLRKCKKVVQNQQDVKNENRINKKASENRYINALKYIR